MSPRRRLALAAFCLILLTACLLCLTRTSPPSGNTPADSTAPTVENPLQPTATDPRNPSPHPAGESDTADSSPSPVSPGSPIPQTPMTVATGGNDAPRISVRTQASGGRTVADILNGVDMTDPDARAKAVAEIKLLEETQQQAVLAKARQLGIPVRIDGPDHKVSILYDFRGDEPLYRTTLNKNAAISSGANLVIPAPYSLTGSGIKVGIWDGGSVRDTHQELIGRVTKKNSSTKLDDHATHVAGTIGASGVQVNAKGMAPQATIDSYDWNSDYAEMTAAGTAAAGDTTGIPLSNHSYGLSNPLTADMGRYDTEARDVDGIAASLPYYLPFWAAGNEQTDLTAFGGYQSITFMGLAKNIVTVGAVEDAVSGSVRSVPAATIAYFSSLGPCDDGRIKPDIVANGINLYSTISRTNTSYDGTYSGTSMATPSAMGSAALLAQLYAREFSGLRMRASTLKALLIHTADNLGTAGPDYTYGWGLINVKTASDVILAHKASLAAPKMIEAALTGASPVNTHTFTWDGVGPIRATVCWSDPAGTAQTVADVRTPNLRHNLDAKITAPDNTTIYQPYVMPFVGTWTQASMSLPATTGKNNVDPIEQVYLAAPTQPGTYTVTVSLDGTLTTSSQTYSLIITGGAEAPSNPPPTVALTSPAAGTAFLPGVPVTISATATDLALGGGPGAVSQVEFFSGTTSLGVDTSDPYSVNWTPSTGGTFSLTAKATDNEAATATSTAVAINILTGDGSPVISSFSPSSTTVGSLVILTGSNFVNVSAVKFNGIDAVFTMDSAGQITATVPDLATNGTISVINSYGTGTSSSSFTIQMPPVLISQIYGGGSNSGATYRQDYVELHNRSTAAVSLIGWSVQYASSTGSTWTATQLSGSIAPGKYYLIGLDSGTSGLVLPTVDVSGTLALSATTGKIALMNTTTVLSGSSPLGNPGLQDFVGFGAANAYEGAAAPAPSTSTAIFRAGSGAVDTGNNAADFTAASPLPRNSAYLAIPPVITSATTATGMVGTAFTYQITASNGPTSYAAAGLPDGLVVNTSTGAITGTPSATGISNVTLSATNSAGTGSEGLAITVNPSGGGTTILLSEDFASITTGNSTNPGGSGTPWAGNSNFPTISNIFQAGGAVRLGSSNQVGSITSKTLNLSGNGGAFRVSFKVKGWSSVEGDIKVTATGLTSQTVTYTNVLADSFESKTLNFTGGTANSTIKFETTAKRAFLDDIVVSYTTAITTPLITATGSPGVTNATYGSPSPAPASFSVSGTDLTAGILVTPPAGFEISQTPGGVTGYAATQTIAGTGIIPATLVYLRLAAGTTVGSYSGNVVCTSVGATPLNVPATLSEVRKKLLTITASDRTKVFGTVLVLGSADFTRTGLVGSETIASVTLSASGTAANDAPGTYPITPSNATGGTADSSNYDINYVAGTLTVTPLSYADWLLAYPDLEDPSATGDPDGDGLANLLEHFMGLHPGIPGNSGISVSSDGSSVSMTYRRFKGATGVGTAEWSTDLTESSWSNSGVSETSVDMGSYEERTATVTKAPGETKKLMHLKVSE